MDIKSLYCDIDEKLSRGSRVVVIIDGMAASGKTTLAAGLKEHYSCTVIKMDHFFLRTEQRTPERLALPGGNIDYERFITDVISPILSGGDFSYHPYDCSLQALSEPVTVMHSPLTVIEGSYSLHPAFTGAWKSADDLLFIRVFLKLSEDIQHSRLKKRNSALYKRFVNEWIPMENKYFKHYDIQRKCDYVFDMTQTSCTIR